MTFEEALDRRYAIPTGSAVHVKGFTKGISPEHMDTVARMLEVALAGSTLVAWDGDPPGNDGRGSYTEALAKVIRKRTKLHPRAFAWKGGRERVTHEWSAFLMSVQETSVEFPSPWNDDAAVRHGAEALAMTGAEGIVLVGGGSVVAREMANLPPHVLAVHIIDVPRKSNDREERLDLDSIMWPVGLRVTVDRIG